MPIPRTSEDRFLQLVYFQEIRALFNGRCDLRSKKKGTKKTRVSKKKASTRQNRRKKPGGRPKVATLDTLGSWLSNQQKKRRSNEKKVGGFASVPDTMEEWLRNQKPAIVEVEQVEVVVPISTTEQWLRGQIESRKLEAEETTSEDVVTSPD
ncbi:MAG TPA: hypothetical protein VJN71_06665 [Nitrososphaerales archaeon]|nr:hypothetical protein [Nitrososphaerales archaeon]